MTFKIKEGVSIAGSQLSDGNRNLTATSLTADAGTGSTSSTTGTVIVTGGVGVSENLNIGGNLGVGGTFNITGETTISGGLVVGGNLTVNGTTTTVNSTTVTVDDKNIELGSVATPTNTTADGGGITLKGASDKTITWLNSTNRWTFNTGIEAVSIQNTPIGSSTASTGAFTTLSASGTTTLSGLLNANLGIAVDTDKFTVADATGNTVIAGTLNVSGTTTLAAVSATTGGFSGQVTSTVATGSAPLVVASTTKVTNLNADLLDGFNTDTANTASTIPVRDASRNLNFSNAVMSGATSGTTTLQPTAAASGTLTLPAATDTLVGRATTDTLTNKTVNLTNNTVSGTLAQFNTALSDADFVSIAGTETLTNKTLTNPTINAGSGVIVLPGAISPAQTAEGSVVWDTDNDLLTVGTGSTRKTLVDTDSTQTLTNKTLTSPTITGVSPVITLTGDVTGTGTLTNLGSVSFATTIAANSVALGTDTTGNYVATIAGTTDQITVTGSGSETAAITLALPQSIATTSNPTFAGATLDAVQIGITAANEIDTSSGNLTIDSAGGTVTVDDNLIVSGDLTVNGTTTTINATTVTVDDKNIELGSVASPTNTTADGGGITLKGATDKTFNWVNATTAWTSSEDLNLLTGKVYEINGTPVLSGTTLGSGVTTSSLTTVGTIGTGTWQGSVINSTYGGTGVNNGGRTVTVNTGNLTFTAQAAGSSVTVPSTGTLTTTSNNLSVFAATTSAQLAGVISDETGSGALVFANTPTLVTPVIGAATGTSLSVTGQLTSTAAVGTAPLVVTSTTRVANLNVATAGTADTWTTARTITIGSTGKSVNGSAGVSWTLAEIGAQASGNYLTTDTNQTISSIKTTNNGINGLQVGGLTNASSFAPDTNSFAAQPFSELWHDLFAFLRFYPTTFETSNGTTFSGATLNRELFAQKENQSISVINGTSILAARWTFSSTAFGSARWLVIGHSFTSPAPNKTVLVESSANAGVSWTTRHQSTYTTVAQNVYHRLDDYAGDDRIRVTITWLSGSTINLSMIRLLTARPGDQGRGKENQLPFTWNGDQDVTIGRDLSANRVTSTVATGTSPLVVTSTTRVANLNAATAGVADTANTWTTARTITVGNTGKSVNGSANVSWSLSEIGAQAAGNYVTTDTTQTISGLKTFSNTLTAGAITADSLTFTTNTTPVTFIKDDNLTSWQYANKSFSVAGQESAPAGIFFKPDGLSMYVIGSTGDDVNEYVLSVAWDVSTAAFVRTSVLIGETGPTGVFFKPDGLSMFVIGSTNDTVREFSLSTAWNISSITFVRDFSVTAQDSVPQDLWFRPDGTKMYMIGSTNDRVYEYNLSTAWNISTASFLQFFSVAAQETTPTAIVFNGDGTKMYVLGATGADITRYSLSTPWNISTATVFNNFYIGFQESSPNGLFINFDTDTAYVVGTGSDTVFQYRTLTDGIELTISSGLFIEGSLYTNNNLVTTGGARIDGVLNVSSPTTLQSSLSVASSATLGSSVNMSTTTGTISIGTAQTTGTTSIGGTAQTGTITVGQSTSAQILNIATGANTSGVTKTVNIGTNGVSGSTTNINIGSDVGGALGTTTVNSNLTVAGNLTINGTTSTVNSTTVTIDDPIFTLGGDTAPTIDDNKDRGIEFRYFDTAARIGFFGYDDSAAKFVFLTAATNTSEVFSGTKGEIDASVDWTNILNKPDPVVTVTLTGDVTGTGNATLTDLASGTISFATTIAANSVALGTDTTGNYVATVAAGTPGAMTGTSGLIITAAAGEGTAATIAHADTSSVADLTSDNSGSTFIQDISFTFDTFGHVTAASVATGNALTSQANDFGVFAINGTDSGFTWGAANTNTNQTADVVSDTLTFVKGGGINLYTNTVAGTDAIKIEHADTSSVTDLTAAANTFIAGQTYDTYGHVTARTTGTVDFTVAANYAFQTVAVSGQSNVVADTSSDTLTFAAGGAITITTDAGTDTVTIAHTDTSSVANLTSDNSGSTFIQDISFTFDTFGHVTAASVATGNALTSQANDFGVFAINGTDSGFTWGAANTNTNQTADTTSDTLTFVKGGGINLYTNTVAGTDAIKIEHADTSSVTDLTAAANTFITAQTYDTYGHVLTRTTGTVDFTVAANHAFQTIAVSGQSNVVADSSTDTLTLIAGTAITITTNATNDTVTIAHTDTSSVSSFSSDNAGNTFIQDISFGFDTNGHVTSASVATGTVSGFSTTAFSTVTVSDTDSGYTWAATGSAVADSTADTVTLVSGAGINIDVDATLDAVRVTNTDRGSAQNIFKNIAVSGQSTVIADGNDDTLTFIAGANITITTNATNDSITIAATGPGDTSTPTLQVVTTQGATTSNAISITNATASTSTTTGALIVSGGVGINGALNATTKSFIIPHPTKENKLLRHGSLEGPEFGVYVRGKLTGNNVIELPDYWINLVDPDSITVDLTPIGKHQKLYVKDIANNQVIVGNDSLFTSDVNCFYVVWAERKDVGKLEVEGDE